MVTITDVARHAGVAVSTVSYVLSGKRAISPTTRERVLASIDLLGYHPHAGARALASRRAHVIAPVDGVLVLDVEMSDARAPVLRELERPSVLIGFPADASGLTCVDLDFAAAGARCVEHLRELGHR